MLRAGATVFKSACEDGKLPHIYLAWLSGALTLVGLATFLLCMCLERPEPELVFVVPLILSFGTPAWVVWGYIPAHGLSLGSV